jgi:hypothetical protein
MKSLFIAGKCERGDLNPYGLTRWILSAKIKNLKALDIRSDFPKSYEAEGFSSFHRVESVLFVSTTSSSFYHKFITAKSMQKGPSCLVHAASLDCV